MKRILLVDDHLAVRRGLRELIVELEPRAVFGEASTAAAALEQAKLPWHAAILDLDLPGRGGLELLHELKQIQPAVAILIYTMHPEVHFAVRCIARGASGYLMKDAPIEEVTTAIAALLAGRRYVTSGMAEALAQTTAIGLRLPHETLSDREHEIFLLLAQGHGVNEIARRLILSPKTISTHRLHILQKMSIRTNAEIVQYALAHRLIGSVTQDRGHAV